MRLLQCFMLAMTYSPSKEVPSVQRSLTSVFGMGTGVPFSLNHQHTALKLYPETIEYGNVVPFHLEEPLQDETVVVGVDGFEPPTSPRMELCSPLPPPCGRLVSRSVNRDRSVCEHQRCCWSLNTVIVLERSR